MSEIKNRISHLTAEQKAAFLKRLQASKKAPSNGATLIKRLNRETEKFPLSFAQQRLWFLEQLEGASPTYNIPFALRLQGELRKDILTQAFNEIIKRHDILRTHFIIEKGTPAQIIEDHLELNIACVQTEASGIIAESITEAHRIFHLNQGPLIRVKLLQISEVEHVLLITMHHIITDGWSTGLLVNELTTLYQAYLDGLGSPLPALPIQYVDFSVWQRKSLTDKKLTQLLTYWKNQLLDLPPLLEMPTDHPRPIVQTFRGANHVFQLDGQLVDRLQQLSQRENVTLFMTLLSAFNVLLAKFANQYDIAVGTVIANRNNKEIENLIGFFVNTLVLRTQFSSEHTFIQLLAIVKKMTLDAYEHQDLPFDQLVKALQPERSVTHSPLFQVMFELNNTPYEAIKLPKLQISVIHQDMQVAKFDLILTLQTGAGSLEGIIEYNTDLFDKKTMERFSSHYVTLLNSILSHSHEPISHLSILTESERHVLLTQYNQTDANFPLDSSVHQLFEHQVQQTPENIAASWNGENMTYSQLDQHANRLAHCLREQGVRREDRIALYLDRGFHFLIAMIGVLKAGAAFVPLDPRQKDKRAQEIIAQCQPKLILSTSDYFNEALECSLDSKQVLSINDILQSTYPVCSPNIFTLPNSLAYIIFTSGSTGKPKGAMLEHKGMVNHLYDKIVDLKLTCQDVIGQIAVQTFDVSIWQFICALLVGGRTAIFTGDHAWDPKLLLAKIAEEGVTILESVPSHTKVILDEQEANPNKYSIKCLRLYITNGEPLAPEQCHRWFKHNPGIALVNAYGATECSDDSHHLHINEPPITDMPYMPVKQPLPNQQTYILDEMLEPTPIGLRGEIYFGGKGVGRGYLDDPIKTALSFIPNPFSPTPGERLYKTGDVARYHMDGSIEFLGRSDFQVKIRGFRIEIGEIEAVLSEHISIESCVVLAKKDERNVNHLICYLVPKSYPAPTIQDIKAHCKSMLPEYMVPEAFIWMDEFPLSNNGKVDRKRLPEPNSLDKEEETHYVEPRNALETQIALVWAEVLSKDKIGIQDHFFKIGGHSLMAAELAIKLQNALNIEIPLRHLFEFPTIEAFISTIQEEILLEAPEVKKETLLIPSEISGIRKFPTSAVYDLAPCQIPEWYAYQVDRNSPVYNISFNDLFFKNLNVDIFMQAWQRVIDRHDSFRVHFDYQEGKPVQKLLTDLKLNREDFYVDHTQISLNQIDEVASKLAYEYSNKAFDFEKGPLFVLKTVAYPDNQYQLLFVIHHIIWDETSTINLFTELAEIYNAILNQREPKLPQLRLNYFDYVQWINESIQTGAFSKQQQYWQDQYKDVPPALNLPGDFPRPALQTYHGDSVASWLPRATLRKLRPYLQQHNVTLFMFMMSIINLYFFRLTGQKDIVIGSPIAGRDHDDFKPILGLFATPMPIRSRLNEKMTFIDLLMHVKQQSLEAYEHHYYPCNLVIEELNHAKDLSRPKLFSVMYGVQNNKTQLYKGTDFDQAERFFKDLYGAEANSARFDLTLVVDQWGSDIAFNCIYNVDIFKKETVLKMMTEMAYLVEEVIDHNELSLVQYQLMPEARMIQQLEVNNQTDADYPDISISQLIETQMSVSPADIAITHGNQQISYQELNAAVNQMANYLLHRGVSKGEAIGVMLVPSIRMITTLLAILKVGGHYVPMSPDYPINRLEYILRNADIKYMLIEGSSIAKFDTFSGVLLCLDEVQSQISIQSHHLLTDIGSSESLAYIIYTSGTTGQPKGIPIRHSGVINLLTSTQKTHHLTHHDSILFLTPFTFDASILDIFWPLAFGARIVIPHADIKNPQEIAAMLTHQDITLFQCVPILLEAIIDTEVKPQSLRLVISGGALLTRALRDRFYALFSCQLFNHYGPTEITVDATRFDCSATFEGEVVPIGRPIANTKIFILDAYLNPVSIGQVGEIYIASPGLTLGYLHDEEKNKNAFIDKLFNKRHYRLYKSGDLAKWDRDGNVHYIGRIDKQVKVRGNRVELEEIDNALLQHADIKHALVKYVPKSPTDGQLIAFIEFNEKFNSFYTEDNNYKLFTLSERPELLRKMHAAHAEAWPVYFAGSKVLKEYWSRLYSEYPEYQIGLVTNKDELAAVGNTFPIYWDGAIDQLPNGWDEALTSAFTPADSKPNTLLILAGIVTTEFQGRQISTEILKAFKALASGHGLTKIIVAVRPTGKANHPEIEFADWCSMRREDGQLKDNWLRMHERVGGKILKIAPTSQYVEGSVSDWEKWTVQKILSSGAQHLPETLQFVDVNLDENTVKYYDPAVWVEHYFTDQDQLNWNFTDKNSLRQFLANHLPAYMIPEQFYFLPEIPLLDTGKMNEKMLVIPDSPRAALQIAAKSEMQKKLLTIWQSVLKTTSIGTTDDFFELGGQSLKAIQMLALIQDAYEVKVGLCHFYLSPTILGLEEMIHQILIGKIESGSCG